MHFLAVFAWLCQCKCVSTFWSCQTNLKGCSDSAVFVMYVNCAERGHQLELAVCTRCAFIHEVGKPANYMYHRHPSQMGFDGCIQTLQRGCSHSVLLMEPQYSQEGKLTCMEECVFVGHLLNLKKNETHNPGDVCMNIQEWHTTQFSWVDLLLHALSLNKLTCLILSHHCFLSYESELYMLPGGYWQPSPYINIIRMPLLCATPSSVDSLLHPEELLSIATRPSRQLLQLTDITFVGRGLPSLTECSTQSFPFHVSLSGQILLF